MPPDATLVPRPPSSVRTPDSAGTDGRGVHRQVLSSLDRLEQELAGGLMREWQALADADPRSSLFQAPGWCVTWYRIYADAYDPRLILLRDGGQLVGLVPMAVDRATRRFDFASGASADYRDILALPTHRRATVVALLDTYLEERHPNVLEVGWIDPRSDTPTLLDEVAAQRGLRTRRRTHPCWRWHPPAPEKPSGQKFLNWYRRHTTVRFEHVSTPDAWQRFRAEYFQQHSLRQLQAGRELSFHDPVRQRFYDALFALPEAGAHVTAMYVNDRLAAGHFGLLWRRVLHLGPPSVSLDEETRSPAVVLLSWVIQNAAELDLDAFDLTIGDTDFKRRLGNQRVELTVVEVHRSARSYHAAELRRALVARARQVVEARWGEGAWKRRVEPLRGRVSYKIARWRELGVTGALRAGARLVWSQVYERRTGLMLAVHPGELRPVQPVLTAGQSWEVRTNAPEDLLAWAGSSPSTAATIGEVARAYGRARASGHALHTVMVDGRLAGWGFSYLPQGGTDLTETPGARFDFPPHAASLYNFHTLPEFRGRRLYQALLTHIVAQRFADGAQAAFIAVLAENIPSRVAIERVGFRVVARNDWVRRGRRVLLNGMLQRGERVDG